MSRTRSIWILILWFGCFASICFASLEALFKAQYASQGAVEGNDNQLDTIIGLSDSSSGDEIMIGVSPAYELTPSSSMSSPLFTRLHNNLVAGVVGMPSDAQALIRVADEYVLQYFSEVGYDISGNLLGMKLADEVFQRSRTSSSPLVYNCLLMGGTEDSISQSSCMIKVDQSGNFFDCKAIAIGHNAPRYNRRLYDHLSKHNTIMKYSTREQMLEIGLQCLDECFHESSSGDIFSGDYKIEVCSLYFDRKREVQDSQAEFFGKTNELKLISTKTLKMSGRDCKAISESFFRDCEC